MAHLIQLIMREASVLSSQLQKFPMEGREQPRLDLRSVLQLMAFVRPYVKRLLGQVAGITFFVGQAQGKSIQGGIIEADQTLKVQFIHHILSYQIGAIGWQFVPAPCYKAAFHVRSLDRDGAKGEAEFSLFREPLAVLALL